MTSDQIVYQQRVRMLAHARETGNVSKTCPVFGVSRKTFYKWRNVAAEYGLEALWPKKRRQPQVIDDGLGAGDEQPPGGLREWAAGVGWPLGGDPCADVERETFARNVEGEVTGPGVRRFDDRLPIGQTELLDRPGVLRVRDARCRLGEEESRDRRDSGITNDRFSSDIPTSSHLRSAPPLISDGPSVTRGSG